MDDEKIKNIFAKDNSTPKKKSDEWLNILNEIDKPKTPFWKPWMSVATVCLIAVIGFNQRTCQFAVNSR